MLAARKPFLADGVRAVPARSASASKAPVKSPSAAPIPPAADGDRPRSACTLADLYDPLAMPPALAKAHAELDRAVEKCYRPEPFPSDRHRVEYLFALYEKLTAPLLPVAPKGKTRRSGSSALPAKPRPEKTPGLYAQNPLPE